MGDEVEVWRSGTDSDQAAVPAPWGGAPLSCVPAAHSPSHPQLRGKASTPLLPQRPQPAPARTPPPGLGPGLVPPVGSEGQREATRHRGRRWRIGVKPAGRRGCNEALRSRSCLPRFTCRAAGSGLRSAVLMRRPPRVRMQPPPRSLRRPRGLQLQWRRRRSGAPPASDSRRCARRPPANSWPGPRDRGAHPRLLPPAAAAPRSAW